MGGRGRRIKSKQSDNVNLHSPHHASFSIDDEIDRSVCCRKMGIHQRQQRWALLYINCLLLGLIQSSASFVLPSSVCLSSSTKNPSPSCLFLARTKKKKRPKDNIVAVNRVAYRNYAIIQTLEAGISLTGTEVKSVRDGKMNIRDGFIRPPLGGSRGLILFNVHIGKHSMSAEYDQHEERRSRSLLVHSEQARKWKAYVEQDGMTIIPLKAYWNDQNKLKLEIALCRGKNVRDKRDDIQAREAKRSDNRIIKNFRLLS